MILLLLLLTAMIAIVELTLKPEYVRLWKLRIPGSMRKYLILGRSTFA